MEKFTVGIEEEYMVIDPETRELKSHDQKIVELAAAVLQDQVKAEMHQAVVEVGTGICRDVEEARVDVSRLRKGVAEIAGSLGLRIGASGTHPFSLWTQQLITPNPRYDFIVAGPVRKLQHNPSTMLPMQYPELALRTVPEILPDLLLG